MPTISVVSGTGTGPTALASYDAALADAGVHNYNLVRVSSVIPTDSRIEVCDAAPDLGPVGGKLTVVEARVTAETPTDGDETGASAGACAGLGWTVDDADKGLFYEASGTDPEAVHERVSTGLAFGRGLREWSFMEEQIVTADTAEIEGPHATAVVLGIYGESQPIA